MSAGLNHNIRKNKTISLCILSRRHLQELSLPPQAAQQRYKKKLKVIHIFHLLKIMKISFCFVQTLNTATIQYDTSSLSTQVSSTSVSVTTKPETKITIVFVSESTGSQGVQLGSIITLVRYLTKQKKAFLSRQRKSLDTKATGRRNRSAGRR